MSILKLGILKDENFQIGNYTLKMIKVGEQEFVLEVKGAMNQRFDIEKAPIEVLPGVRISAGRSEHYIPTNKDFAIRRAVVIIDAPKEMVIHRFKGDERFAA